jgi:hypothetical protein
MIVTSLLTQRTLPGHVGQVMLRMHLPEALSRQDYRSFPLDRTRRPAGR